VLRPHILTLFITKYQIIKMIKVTNISGLLEILQYENMTHRIQNFLTSVKKECISPTLFHKAISIHNFCDTFQCKLFDSHIVDPVTR